ncbi:uncharacterized protein LOC132560854 [Ylistrum balloti]|uniref:uncharacterized protein LOC132560854 n=1 Tax=Ylistrum balloti TaxID=509963 RepID=UPI0029059BAA|nr:uncharacterized protein LOC132560854 [Ylistrum balloti]
MCFMMVLHTDEKLDNTIRYSDISTEVFISRYIVIVIISVAGNLFISEIEQYMTQFRHMDIIGICFSFAVLHSQVHSQEKDVIVLEFLIYLPYLIDFGFDIFAWCLYYVYHVSKYYTFRSIIQYLVYLLSLTMLLITAVMSCGLLIQNQAGGIGNQLSAHQYITTRVDVVRPVDRVESFQVNSDYQTTLNTQTKPRCPESSYTATKTVMWRYPGEDIQMKCQYDIDIEDFSSATPETLWFRDKQVLTIAERHRVELGYEMIGSTYQVTSLLTILMADSKDFAIYECWGENRSMHSKQSLSSHILTLRAFFNITQISHVKKTVFAPVGLLMTVQPMDYYIFSHDTIKFNHMVEGLTERLFVPHYHSVLFGGCSPLTALYSSMYCYVFSKSKCIKLPLSEVEFKNAYLFQYSYHFCTHPQNLCKHTMQIERNVRNGITGDMEHHVYDLPLSVNLVPDTRFLYMEMDNRSYTDDISVANQNSLRTWHVIFEVFWWIRMVIECCLIGMLHVTMSYMLSKVWDFMMKYLVIRMKRIILKRTNLTTDILQKKRENYRMYDALILHHEEDQDIVRDCIVTPLEKAGHRILFPARDWADKGNKPAYKIHAGAIETSKGIIVVYSDKFKSDPFCMRTYLESMTIARVQHGYLSQNSVCIVSLQPCARIPRDVEIALPKVHFLNLVRKRKKGRQVDTFEDMLKKWIH